MYERLQIKSKEWDEFERIITRNLNSGFTDFEREVLAFCAEYSWQKILRPEDKSAFRSHIRMLRGHLERRSLWELRRKQINDGCKFWVFGADRDCPVPNHHQFNGLILPPHHAFWQIHYPPKEWGCYCKIRGSYSINGARRIGGIPEKELPRCWNQINPETTHPTGVDQIYSGEEFPTLIQFFSWLLGKKLEIIKT